MDEWNAGRTEFRVAIVEDEKDLALMYEMILAKMDIQVSFVAHSGVEAIVKFKNCAPKPRVVLMDNRLPSMSGVEAMKAILSLEPDTRIIFLSADIGTRDEAIRAGAALFIDKPARVGDIVDAVRSVGNPTPDTRPQPRSFAFEPIGSW